jgi:dTDP-4-dehydrorhamnose 3,5-epimerase
LKVTPTSIPDVLIIEPDVFEDERGFFMETYHEKRYREMGIDANFVQDNLSYSKKGVLRGLHYQYPNAQAKLIHVIQGEIFDVAVDLRINSLTFGKWVGEILSNTNKKQFLIPADFAHGFCVLSETALVAYKCNTFYSAEDEKGILWNDPDLKIAWPLQNPLVSEKDQNLRLLKNAVVSNQ